MDIIWEASLDNRYDCKVERIDKSNGRLTVIDTTNNKLLLDNKVGLMYGSVFGPDISDIEHWQDLIIQTIDG
jgi:hypothetical protein